MTNTNNAILSGKASHVSINQINGRDAMSFIIAAKDPSRRNQEGEAFTYNVPVSVRGPLVERLKTKLADGVPALVCGRFEPYNVKDKGTRYQVNAQSVHLVDAGEIDNIVLQGRLTHEPEIRHTANGTPVISTTIACNRSYQTKEGEWKDSTSFIDIVIWAELAEGFSFRKGESLWVVGKLTSRSYEGKDGVKRYPVEVVATQISSGGTGKNSTAAQNQAAALTAPTSLNPAATPQIEEEFGDFSDDDLPF